MIEGAAKNAAGKIAEKAVDTIAHQIPGVNNIYSAIEDTAEIVETVQDISKVNDEAEANRETNRKIDEYIEDAEKYNATEALINEITNIIRSKDNAAVIFYINDGEVVVQ